MKDINLSPKARGFHPGDDDRLQNVIRKNLEKHHKNLTVSKDTAGARRVKKQLQALEEIKRIDEAHDPEDKHPDDPHPG